MKKTILLIVLIAVVTFSFNGKTIENINGRVLQENFSPQDDNEKKLLEACLANDKTEVKRLIALDINLKTSREASYNLYKILQNQTVKGALQLVNFQTEWEYPLRKPTDINVFNLLVRAGTDAGLHKIVGFKSEKNEIDLGDGLTLYLGSDEKNQNSSGEIIYQSKDGMDAIEFATINKLSYFIKALKTPPLFIEIENENLAGVKRLLKNKVDVNAQIEQGISPLYIACQYGYPDITKCLLENGANPNLIINNGDTPLTSAVYSSNLEIIKQLIAAGANINTINKELYSAPFRMAVKDNKLEVIELLLSKGINPNIAIAEDGLTALYYSSQEGNTELVNLLLKSGVSPEKSEFKGATALFIASSNGYKEIVELLIKYGANINKRSVPAEYTPVMLAIEKNKPDIVKFLIEKGADINLSDISGDSPLHFAIKKSDLELATFLVKSGANLNKKNNKKETPLYLAAVIGNYDIIQFLINVGADEKEADYKGQFIDERDGRHYNWIRIGKQVWMTENLAYLPFVCKRNYKSKTKPAYYVYDYNGKKVNEAASSEYYLKYGTLYNYQAAKDACPSGWHLPTNDEWEQLQNHLHVNRYQYDSVVSFREANTYWRDYMEDKIAKSLASCSGWNTSAKFGNVGNDQQSNNKAGFSALPGGYRKNKSEGFLGAGNKGYLNAGERGYWWVAKKHYFDRDSYTSINYSQFYLYFSARRYVNYPDKYPAYSIRCIRDIE